MQQGEFCDVRETLSTGVPAKKAGGSSGGGSSDGDSDGSHGRGHGEGNRSMDGIVLHILADISQSIGLTIAGALLWCEFPISASDLLSFSRNSFLNPRFGV